MNLSTSHPTSARIARGWRATTRIATVAAAAAVLTAALTACDPAEVPGGVPITTPAASGAPVNGAPAPTGIPATTGPSAVGFTATTIRLSGPWYELDVPQVAGGAAGPREEFNQAMLAHAQEWIDRVDGTITLRTGHGQVTHIGSRVLSGLLVISVDGGGAHPYNAYATQVTDAVTGDTLTLEDLFTDVDAGLGVLAPEAVEEIHRTRGEDFVYSSLGVHPLRENYQLWLVTPEGMEVHFPEIAAHAAGDVVVTVPWSRLETVLAPGMLKVVTS